jgi:hypothetical protein
VIPPTLKLLDASLKLGPPLYMQNRNQKLEELSGQTELGVAGALY